MTRPPAEASPSTVLTGSALETFWHLHLGNEVSATHPFATSFELEALAQPRTETVAALLLPIPG